MIEIIRKLEKSGYRVSLSGDKVVLDFIGKDMPERNEIAPLIEQLKKHKTEVIEFLQKAESEALNERMAIIGENTSPDEVLPYVTDFGVLVIPFNSPERYHWWKGGMSPCDILRELGRCDLLDNIGMFRRIDFMVDSEWEAFEKEQESEFENLAKN